MADLVVAVELAGRNELSGPVRAATQSLDELGDRAEHNTGRLGGLQTALLSAGAVGAGALAAGFAASVASAADFEAKLSGIQAVTGASGAEMAQLGQLALQLGRDTSFSAAEAADGIGELAKGGVSVADIMGGAALTALNLAAAGGESVADSAALAANAMSLFGIEGDKTAAVADRIAGFANATTGSMVDFKYALTSVGSVAALTGQEFDQTATAISLMGRAGILGSDAGTSLKTMLNNLIPTTKSANAAMRDLGLITEDGSNKFLDAEGNFRDLRDISEELFLATKDLSEGQRSLALETIFGADAIRAAAIMAKGGAAAFDEMAAVIEGISAADVAATRLDNLKGSMEAMGGSLDTVAIVIGQSFTPAIRELVDQATLFLNTVVLPWAEQNGPAMAQAAVAAATAFGQLLGVIGNLITGAASLGQAVSENTLVFSTLGGLIVAGVTAWGLYEAALIAARIATLATTLATQGMTVAQAALNVVLTANPIGIVVVALAGLTAALIIAYNTNEDFRNAVDGAWRAVQAVAEQVFPVVGALIGTVLTIIGDLIAAAVRLPTDVGDAFEALGTTVRTAVDGLTDALSGNWQGIVTGALSVLFPLGGGLFLIGSHLEDIRDTAVDATEDLRDKILTIWEGIPVDIRDDLDLIGRDLVSKTGEFLGTVGDWLTEQGEAIATAWEAAETTVGGWLTAIGTAISTAWAAYVGLIQTGQQAILTAAVTAWAALQTAIGLELTAIATLITTAWTDLVTQTGVIWGGVSTAIGTVLRGVVTSLGTWTAELVTALQGVATAVGTEAVAIGTAIIDGIKSGITGGIQGMKDTAGAAVRGVLDYLKSPAVLGIESPSKTTRDEIGVPFVQGIGAGITAEAPALLTTAQGVATDLSQIFISASSAALAAWQQVLGQMVQYTAPVPAPAPPPTGPGQNPGGGNTPPGGTVNPIFQPPGGGGGQYSFGNGPYSGSGGVSNTHFHGTQQHTHDMGNQAHNHLRFATGGLVTGPMFGLLGEDPRTLPEIVSPVATMRDVVRGELRGAGGGPAIVINGDVYGEQDFLEKLARAAAQYRTRNGRTL